MWRPWRVPETFFQVTMVWVHCKSLLSHEFICRLYPVQVELQGFLARCNPILSSFILMKALEAKQGGVVGVEKIPPDTELLLFFLRICSFLSVITCTRGQVETSHGDHCNCSNLPMADKRLSTNDFWVSPVIGGNTRPGEFQAVCCAYLGRELSGAPTTDQQHFLTMLKKCRSAPLTLSLLRLFKSFNLNDAFSSWNTHALSEYAGT